jgi:hypothetical protein
MSARQVRDRCKLDAEGKGYLEYGMQELNFSALWIGSCLSESQLFVRLDHVRQLQRITGLSLALGWRRSTNKACLASRLNPS